MAGEKMAVKFALENSSMVITWLADSVIVSGSDVLTAPEKPKKVVTKNATLMDITTVSTLTRWYEFAVPQNAKNVKCTYEIEE